MYVLHCSHKEDSDILDQDNRELPTENDSSVVRDEAGGLEMSDKELKETTVEMLFAGYMTTASIATSAIINLIRHPEVFSKLEDELRRFGLLTEQIASNCSNNCVRDELTPAAANGCGSSQLVRQRRQDSDMFNNNSPKTFAGHHNFNENVLTVDALSKMTYLEQFFKETLRIMPPILGGYRLALKTFQLGVRKPSFLLSHAHFSYRLWLI